QQGTEQGNPNRFHHGDFASVVAWEMRKESIAARVGALDCAPGCCTDRAAAAWAKRMAAGNRRPSVSATARQPLNTSPAAVLSTAVTGNPVNSLRKGSRRPSCWER